MANNDRAGTYYGETPDRTSRQSEARHQDNRRQGGSHHNQTGRDSVYANSSEFRHDDEESRDTPNARTNQSRVASENSRQSEIRTPYSEYEEQNSTRTKSHAQSVMSNNARARERRVAPKEFDVTSELLQDTVNIKCSLFNRSV